MVTNHGVLEDGNRVSISGARSPCAASNHSITGLYSTFVVKFRQQLSPNVILTDSHLFGLKSRLLERYTNPAIHKGLRYMKRHLGSHRLTAMIPYLITYVRTCFLLLVNLIGY